ncbi:cysteine--tRNA ligase, chloroplastic/mitochondrial isoform X1 [Gossypium australe]|uniref:cysteine--tRNA ligase n=1 Tax=Gossypium australe TaxID=47621 RepID=A0A5B6WG63_9ROSI|nr:cysteine--tRNA ligase, chloroplastic/mitochondrial isoform X1 [Gossypium australe]
MGTLLKCYKPLFSIRFSLFPNSLHSVQLRTHSFNNPKRRNPIRRCFSSLSPSSQPLINGTTLDKMDGNRQPGSPSSELWLHNTMSKKKELFKSKVEDKVGMYVCGVTAYDLSHIGHARVYVTFDVLYRYLKHLGYEVCYVRNFTDVDDKIIARANELAEDPISLSRQYCDEFIQDMVHLQCLPPSVEPRVSDHMPHIIDMIKQIVDNGYAYRVEGDVFFSVENFPEYGQLSGRKLEDNRAGERVAVDSRKRNPADFALWKASFIRNNVWINCELWEIDTQPTLLKSRTDQAAHGILNVLRNWYIPKTSSRLSAKEGEPFWESPWGPGRPGWHIECSAMSAAYLGYSFDIHGGGMDLVFPHHENEIAQSCAACKQSNVSYWIHNGFVTVDSEKMSKSLGNFFTIREVIDLYHPLALRLFLMGTHYRSPINYSDVLLESASERIFYIYQTLHDCENVLSQHDKGLQESIPPETLNVINKFHNDFSTSMSDDLHTPVVLAALSDPLKTINDLLHTRKGKKQAMRIESVAALEKIIRNVLSVLGLMPTSYSEALQQLREMALKRAKLTEDKILQKIEERSEARKNKDYEKSDAIRKDLAVVGIALMDSPDGTSWRPAIPLPLQEQQVAAT